MRRRRLSATKISANHITIGGFLLGLVCCYAVAQGLFAAALVFPFAKSVGRRAGRRGGAPNRSRPHLGAYIDIVSDFLLWSLLPLAFICFTIANNAFAAALLLSSFAMSMTVFLAFAIQAEKLRRDQRGAGQKKACIISPVWPRARRPSRFSPSPCSTPPFSCLPHCCLPLLSIFQ